MPPYHPICCIDVWIAKTVDIKDEHLSIVRINIWFAEALREKGSLFDEHLPGRDKPTGLGISLRLDGWLLLGLSNSLPLHTDIATHLRKALPPLLFAEHLPFL